MQYNSPRENILKKLDSNIKVIPILKKDKSLQDVASRDYVPNQKKRYMLDQAPARITLR